VTLARDLRSLLDRGYLIERIVAFDMFPQTYHVETIVYLRKACGPCRKPAREQD
jgi:23S rRNA (uracil1939-C5)-methyltransferase